MSKEFILTMQDVRKVVAGREIIKGMHLSFYPGAKIGVIGANGSGKSTLLRIIAGEDTDYMGSLKRHPKCKVGYVAQEPYLDPNLTVHQTIESSFAEVRSALQQFDKLAARFAEPMDDSEMEALLEEQGRLQDIIDANDGWGLDRQIALWVAALGLPDAQANIETLSGGERRRVSLVKTLLEKPDLLLLDEPTNHLDAESVAWLEKQLKNYSGCIICVTHDRYFLDHVAEWILELDRGEGIPYKGNYAAWLEQKEARLSVSEKTLSAKRKYLQHELEWVRLSSKGRTVKQKARLQAYERLLAETQTKNQGPSPGEIFIPAGPRLQGTVIEAADLTKSYGERVLFKDLSFSLPPGGIVGVIGKNGAGKSTLFRILTDRESPDTGSLKIGEHVVLGYVDQHRTDLDSDKTVFEEVCEGLDYLDLGSHRMASRAYLALFAFRGTEQNKKVKGLSGGERNRLFLAKMLRSGANVLLLDEPTNDLDVDTLRSLEEALQQFAGCAVIISHDRWFLDRVATHILAFEGNGETFFYSGNYQEYEQDKLKRKSIASSSK